MIRPDVAIIKPDSQKKIYGELSAFDLTGIEPPLWAALLAGYLRQQGYSVELRDAEVEQWDPKETAEKIKEINPRLAVVSVSGSNPSASTMNMPGAADIIRYLKEIAPEIKTLFHGLHPSALPGRTLDDECSDFVCAGEGFFTLPPLLDCLKENSHDYEKIEGLWFKDGARHVSGPASRIFKPLDDLPRPAWDLLPMEQYRAHNWHCFDNIEARQPYGVLYTSLGCPYKCTFCCINAIFDKPGIRYRSPESVIAEIDFLVTQFGVRNIKVIDELFLINEKRVLKICDLIIERGYDLNCWVYARIDTVTPAMLGRLKQAGIHWIAYGFESGSKKVLDGVNKAYKVDAVERVVRQTFEEGLYIGANFIFGLPDDDYDSMQETLDMAVNINAEWANFYSTMAYPGSQLYRDALKQNVPVPKQWSQYSQYSADSLPLATKHLTPGEVLAFRDYAFHTYFENPRYLKKIHQIFGIKTVEHIQGMTKSRLKRNNRQFP